MSESDIAFALARITQATTELDLSDLDLSSGFDDLWPRIGQLARLRELSLSNTGLTRIGCELGKLHSLEVLELNGNQLRSLPPGLRKLQGLRLLNLDGNQLKALSPWLGKLQALQGLYLSRNQLQVLPPELGNLQVLEQLYLNGNQLQFLPPELGKLQALQGLYLNGNQLQVLPPELGNLQALQWLSLSRNQLHALPPELGNLQGLQKLYLHDNQLDIPNDVLGARIAMPDPASPARILDYYFKLQEDSPRPLHEAKLILVGRGSVGKTSLVNRIVHSQFNSSEGKTDGICITEWGIQLADQTDVKLNVWDFGGQEIMHATHQFFLTERSLYLVVLNGREGGEDADAEYWLRLVESFAGDSPVIVVLNKVKDHDFDLDRRGLRKKFPSIRGFVKTDCAGQQPTDTRGLDELVRLIRAETDQLDGLRAKFPKSWFSIKERLAGLRDEEEKYLSFEQYQAICAEHGEKDEQAQENLAAHLHDLGIALNYKEDPRLRDTHVLSPHWVTTGIYKILNAQDLANKEGELGIADLGQVLDKKEYPLHLHAFLIDLMRKFDLCFAFQDHQDHYLVPELLGKEAPPDIDDFDPESCLNFEYHYPIHQEGLIPRFIVRTHVLSRNTPRWRSGVILEFEGSRALIRADAEERKVVIRLQGTKDSMQRLLAVIRADFEHIHRSFKFKAEAMVPVPGHPKHFERYEDLQVRADRGKYGFDRVIDGDFVDLDVREMLRLVDLKPRVTSRRETRDPSGVRLFYSYAHKDEALRDELDTHLKILERMEVISTWHDRLIKAGDQWAGKIDENLERADIILLLVSADFIASDYCWENEMKRALERQEQGTARVIPIVLRNVDWSGAPFASLQALPKDAQAVDTWSNKDSAWRDVSEGIKRVALEFAEQRS